MFALCMNNMLLLFLAIMLQVHQLLLFLFYLLCCAQADDVTRGNKLYQIKGQLVFSSIPTGLDLKELFQNTHVTVGSRYGFLRNDGSFVVSNLPSGSFILEVNCPKFEFPLVRIDINPKNDHIRARLLDLVKPNYISQDSSMVYPLILTPERIKDYFEQKQPWNLSSILMNPMVLMLVLPATLMLILPKLMGSMDPGAQKDMEDSMQKIQSGKDKMPELADLFTSWFGGGQPSREVKKVAKKKKN